LRTLLVAMTACCLVFGFHIVPARRQQAAIETVHRLGGTVTYEFESDASGNALHGPPLYQLAPRGPKWARRWLGPDHFNSVVGVSLEHPAVLDDDLQWLAGLPKLKLLELSKKPLTIDFMEELRTLQRPERPTLMPAGFQDSRMRTIAGLTELRHLVLDERTTDASLAHLRGLTKLQWLSLIYSKEITDAGLAHLAGLTELRMLDLDGGRITDEGMKHLAGLTKLEYLYVSASALTDASVESLTKLTSLRRFDSGTNSPFSAAAIARIKSAIPGVEVWTWPIVPRGERVFNSFYIPESESRVRRLGTGVGVHSLTVRDVLPSSPAAKAGVQKDDVITSVDGKAITNAYELTQAVQRVPLGGTVSVSFRRGTAVLTATMVLDNF
jgi:hypothetical protein